MEETWRREENFILGRALNRLELSHNRRQGKDEIIFKYVDSGIPKTCTFGNSWEEAFANFMKDDSWITTARERLDKDLGMFLRDVDTKPKRDALWFMLDGTMKAVREGLEDKEKNPIYSKYTDIWLRIVKNNGLYDERNQPAERNRNLIDSPSQEDGTKREERERGQSGFDDPEKLSKLSEYVNAAFSKSKDGNLSRAYQDMLKRKQAECRISDEGLARLMDGARIKLVGGSKSELYRTVVADVLSKGVAGEEMEAILTEKRLDLGLSAEEAQSIEDEEKRSVYGALFERFSSGGTIADDERALLTEKQIDLELSDDEVQSIEAEYSKRR